MEFSIQIPTDNDGFVLMQCRLCNDYFKVTPRDYVSDTHLEIRCPNCGLISGNYFTQDVLEAVQVMAQNHAVDLIFCHMKQWERKSRGKFFSFRPGKKPVAQHVNPIHTTIEALQTHEYRCCGRTAKIRYGLIMTSTYCPFCGVKEFEAKQD